MVDNFDFGHILHFRQYKKVQLKVRFRYAGGVVNLVVVMVVVAMVVLVCSINRVLLFL